MEIKRINDYVDKVHQKFDKLDKEEIRKILNYGFKLYYYLNYQGGDIILKDTNKLKFLMYTGRLFNNFTLFYKYYIKKYSIKLRILDKRKKEDFNHIYYFGLTDTAYIDYELQKNDDLIILENILLFRLLDELKTHNQYKHYFKLKCPDDKSYCIFKEHFEIESCNLIKL